MGSLTRAGLGRAPALLFGLFVLLPSARSAAQQPVGAIVGVIRDSAGKPIAGVEVLIAARARSARTDSGGVYRFAGVRVGRAVLSFRRFGYEPTTLPAAIDAGRTTTVNVVLSPLVQELPGMIVMEEEERAREALQDFYHRKESMPGFFLTRADIEKRNPLNLSDMMRAMPGAILLPQSVGSASVLRFARSSMGGRDCPPQYYVDGVPAVGLNIDDLNPQEIEGIEVYTGPSRVPPQFNNARVGTAICGVVVVWTRVPGT